MEKPSADIDYGVLGKVNLLKARDMNPARILVVDDEESMCKFMQIMLEKEGYQVTATQSSNYALEEIEKNSYDLIIADLMMPEMSGIELLSRVKSIHPDISFIVMTAFASVDTAIEALKNGAFDYVTKPFKVDEVKIAIKKSLEHKRISKENISLKKELRKEFSFANFIGDDPQIIKMKEMAKRVAESESTILIQGESGTGKELVAKAIHYHSRRSDKPFVTINCAAIPENLLESELFGHIKGAFTGAIRDKDGLLKVADEGTFFLDEIAITSPAIQMKLLRVLEEKEVTPVGGTKPINVDVRLIAATNADLEQEVKLGNFRPDLFYRLNVIPITIPPLRERTDDIKLLAFYFIKKYCAIRGVEEKTISERALEKLVAYHWPGNVRELENTIERVVLLAQKKEIDLEDLPEKIKEGVPIDFVTETKPSSPTLEEIEKAYINWVLQEADWHKAKAAKMLGIDSSTLYRKIEKYKLKV
ncbi:MAG: sigma-54 dependent transcriptional regulator [candidate division Zixibacteria bacterium]|nr:sigma-54 dependent transcriptional regulator [candidate division Zixibacteria bacterium]